jgi:hypothetical protein
MRYFRLFSITVLACPGVWGAGSPRPADDLERTGITSEAASAVRPSVLRPMEPPDSVVVTLPGPPPRAVVKSIPAAPIATIVMPQPPPLDLARPVLRRVKPNYPSGFEQDSAEYLRRQLGAWDVAAAVELLGEASRSRRAYDSDKTANGHIYAFSDPTGRYKQLELDFDEKSGKLRTVFVYPHTMSWQQCRRAFGTNVRATQANSGRTFYSYADRRLDVLVDGSGQVISLGMY